MNSRQVIKYLFTLRETREQQKGPLDPVMRYLIDDLIDQAIQERDEKGYWKAFTGECLIHQVKENPE